MTPGSFLSYPQCRESSFLSGDTSPSSYSSLTWGTLMETDDGNPGLQADEPLIRTTTNSNKSEGSIFHNPIYRRTESQMEWTGMQTSDLPFIKPEYSYDYSPSDVEMYQDDLSSRGPNNNFAWDYTLPQSYGTRTSMPIGMRPGFPPEYRLNSPQDICTHQMGNLHSLDYITDEHPGALSRQRISQGPTIEDQRSSDTPLAFEVPPAVIDTSPSQTSDDGDADGIDGNISAIEERISDEPYAKLIYRALLTAPNHSMVLQDIYQWFMDHTDKAHSTSTGWRNSIRHNLSMNAAFRKTNRKANGEEAKRTSEWVLEPFAIKDGVTPTTRYRKSSKKSNRPENTAPSHVRAGRASAASARKAKLARHKPQDVYQDMVNGQRSHVPMPYHPSTAIDHHSFIPSAPGCHQLSNGSPYVSELPSFDNLMPYGVQMNDGSILKMEMFAPYEDGHPYLLLNSPF